MKHSSHIDTVPRSGIREIFDLANRTEGAIHLEVGEPDFFTPAHVIEAAAQAARDGFTKYTPNAGITPLREVLADKVQSRNGIDASADQVVVTPGAVAGLYGSLAALVDPGDDVLLPDPAWPNYTQMLAMHGMGEVRYPLRAEDGFVPKAEHIEPRITPNTRAIILNSPGNPSGAITPSDAIRELLDLASQHDLWVLSDEVYDEIFFEEPPAAMAPLDQDGRVVTFFSFSKTYAMTGWRVGYLISPPDVATHIIKTQEPVTSCVNAPAQQAAIAAMTGPQDVVDEMRTAYTTRKELVVDMLEKASVPHVRPRGAFYIMVDVGGTGMDGHEFALRLLKEKQVAVVPGAAFGPDTARFVRVSLATAPDLLTEGVSRLIAGVGEWNSTG